MFLVLFAAAKGVERGGIGIDVERGDQAISFATKEALSFEELGIIIGKCFGSSFVMWPRLKGILSL